MTDKPLWTDARIKNRWSEIWREMTSGPGFQDHLIGESYETLAREIAADMQAQLDAANARVATLEGELRRIKPDHDYLQMLRKISES